MKFQIAGGSVPGTDHTKPGKPGWTNNQDAFEWRETDNCLVAVVCDGCGSGSHSEVGSNIAVPLMIQFLAEAAEKYVSEVMDMPDTKTEIGCERVKTLVLGHIAVLAKAMGGSFSQTINDHFLFTLVGVVITPWNAFLFSMGDGVFVINGEVLKLGPFPDNTPPYLAYNLTGSTLTDTDPELLKIKVIRVGTSDLQSLLIGSDGVLDLIAAANEKLPHRNELVGGIDQFWTNDFYFENSDAVRRRLAIVNREGAEVVGKNNARVTSGLLSDDTTFIVIRQDPNEKEGV